MGVGILAVNGVSSDDCCGNELKHEVERSRAWPVTKALNDERVDGLDSPIARQFQVQGAFHEFLGFLR